jgi:hypothetical protein
VGAEFQVNTYTTSYQVTPVVAVEPDGEFVVVWTDAGLPPTYPSPWNRIKAQRYASNGSPVGTEFQVDTGGYMAFRPTVATEPDGDLIVVWAINHGPLIDFDVRGQRYASNGSTVGTEFQVNSYMGATGGGPYAFPGPRPAVAAEPDGDFVVVWQGGSYGTDSTPYSIQGQRFGSNGSPVGVQFQVNTYTTNSQGFPDVAMQPDGDFFVVWQSDGAPSGDTSDESVRGQRYASNGSSVGAEFQINAWTTGSQYYPAVAAESDGDFLVVWHGDAGSIRGQRYASDGSPAGSEFQVNTSAANYRPPALATTPGGFVVAWTGGDGAAYGVKGQRLSNSGPPIGGPFVNPANGSTYYLLAPDTWHNSEEQAVALGGHLVTIDDAAENAWVFSTFEDFAGTPRNLWIGLTDHTQEGTWAWVSGAPVAYTNWKFGEPNDASGTEDYGMIFNRFEPGAPYGPWNDMFNGPPHFGGFPVNGVVEIESAKVPALSTRGEIAFALLLALAALAHLSRRREARLRA